MNRAPSSFLLNAILAIVDLASTRARLRRHVNAAHGPEVIRRARTYALSQMADAAAFDVLPMSRAEIRRWATIIDGGLEDLADDWALARELCRGLPVVVAAPIRGLVNAPPATCHGACSCLCGHTCLRHDLRGGRCSVEGCSCTSHVERTSIAEVFAGAELIMRGLEARMAERSARDTLPDVDQVEEAAPADRRAIVPDPPRGSAWPRGVTLAEHFTAAAVRAALGGA